MTRAHQDKCVGQAQTVAKLRPVITRNSTAYHQEGTPLYFRIIFVWLSSSTPRTARARIHISSPWKRMVWNITALIAANDRPYDSEKVVDKNNGE